MGLMQSPPPPSPPLWETFHSAVSMERFPDRLPKKTSDALSLDHRFSSHSRRHPLGCLYPPHSCRQMSEPLPLPRGSLAKSCILVPTVMILQIACLCGGEFLTMFGGGVVFSFLRTVCVAIRGGAGDHYGERRGKEVAVE